MAFIRENIVKIIIFIVVFVILFIVFIFLFGGKKTVVKTTYSSMEESMVIGARKYLNKNKSLYPKDEEISKVNLDTIENAKYINTLYAIEDKNVKCTGYVEITLKNKQYVYVPYLKCGKHYETKTIANYIKDNENIVTSGEGLYNYDGTYIYRGENPKNFIAVGNRLYRIIEIKDNDVKLISYKKVLDNVVWDNRYNTEKNRSVGINDFNKSRLKETFETILKTNDTVDDNKAYFSKQEMEKMAYHDICIGKRATSLGDISNANECQQVIANQKLSLITVSDYAKASLDENCKTIFDRSCVNYNYFSKTKTSYKTITATTDNSYQVFSIFDGVATLTSASNTFSTGVVIYLNASSLYLDGEGTYQNPYTIR